ncbi:hypothetical protein DIPPA_28257 [Diplonema papillatum]|nr:hypothetical protein DIPPA_28257 [Diplonema papillatum]
MVGYRSEYAARKGRPAGHWESGSRGEGSHRMRPYESRHDESELVRLVKNAQRTGGDWKEKWCAYCEEHGGGTMDPSRHPAKFLIDAVRVLGIPGDESVGEELTLNRLIDEIKQRQRGSTSQHAAWTQFCDDNGDNGRYDPAHYDVEFLQRALQDLKDHDGGDEKYDGRATGGRGGKPAGKRPEKEATGLSTHLQKRGETQQDLIDLVKVMQKDDPAAHVSWQEFCDARGDGTLDPKRHPYEFLVGAITFMRKSVFLVNTIREMTRSSPERARWVEFCNEKGDGVYDPMLHNTEFLEKAFNSIAPRSGGRGRNAIPWFLKFTAATAEAMADLDEDDLVTSLRLLQKEHPEVSFAWKVYCDANGDRTYDPARHTDRFLRDAVRDLRYRLLLLYTHLHL